MPDPVSTDRLRELALLRALAFKATQLLQYRDVTPEQMEEWRAADELDACRALRAGR